MKKLKKKKIANYNHDKYIVAWEFHKLTAENFAARLKEAKSATIDGIDDFVKKTVFDKKLKKFWKVTPYKTKHIKAKKTKRYIRKFN